MNGELVVERTTSAKRPPIPAAPGSGALIGVPVDTAWTFGVLAPWRPGSAGVFVLSETAAAASRFGSSSSVVDCRVLRVSRGRSPGRPAARAAHRHVVLFASVAEQAREVLAALGLNKSQLADVLGISRPTLYEWLEGHEPKASNAERLAAILESLAEAGVTSSAPLNAKFVRQPVLEGEPSLLELLSAKPLAVRRIERLLAEARRLGDRLASRRADRESRLRALGYEEPTDEQRREQLGSTVAQRDWPRG